MTMSVEVGGGRSTYLWLDNWVGEAPLKVQFPHLFDITQDKETSVSEMEERGWVVGGGAWVWRRSLLAWEEEVVRNVRLCYLTLFCRTLFLIGDVGVSIQSMVTLSKELISISRHYIHLWSGAFLTWCG